jgi:hypothetical protein
MYTYYECHRISINGLCSWALTYRVAIHVFMITVGLCSLSDEHSPLRVYFMESLIEDIIARTTMRVRVKANCSHKSSPKWGYRVQSSLARLSMCKYAHPNPIRFNAVSPNVNHYSSSDICFPKSTLTAVMLLPLTRTRQIPLLPNLQLHPSSIDGMLQLNLTFCKRNLYFLTDARAFINRRQVQQFCTRIVVFVIKARQHGSPTSDLRIISHVVGAESWPHVLR